MSVSIWDIKGAQCVRSIFGALGNPIDLKQAITTASMGQTPNLQSCMQNAAMLGNVVMQITGNNKIPVQGLFPMNQKTRVAKVGELLNTPRAVFIDITPDHHFMVLSVSPTQVVIMQAYQDSYGLLDWLKTSEGGYRPMDTFLDDLTELISTNKATNSAAAVRLFSFPTVANTVRNIYLNATSPSEINGLSYIDL